MGKQVARRTNKNVKAPMFVLLALIFLVIGIIATFFSFFVVNDLKKTNDFKFVSATSSENNSSTGTSSEDKKTSSSQSSENTSSTTKPQENVYQTLVAESESVDKSYFQDAVFIGDSISQGLKIYGVVPVENVLADKGININSIVNDKPVYQALDGNKKSLFECLKQMPVKKNKIYILLGSNGLPFYENPQHIADYANLIDRLKAEYPESIIYVQSLTPLGKNSDYEATHKKKGRVFNNAKINDFNKLLLEMAKQKQIYYLNVREALVDKEGFLSSEFAAKDGMHFMKVGHEAMYQYYKTHTVQKAKPDDSSKETVSQ